MITGASPIRAAPNETMREHVGAALRALEEFFLSRGVDRLVARRTGLEPGLVRSLYESAVAFHDIGKAYDEYQLRIEEAARRGGDWSVPKHEFYSALALYRALERVDPELRVAAAAAVALHHLATRGPMPREALGPEKSWKMRGFPVRVTMSRWGEVVELLRGFLRDGVVDPLRIPREACYRDLRELAELLKPVVLDPSLRQYRVTLYLLRAVIVCDNVAAAVNRGGRVPLFAVDIVGRAAATRLSSRLRGVLGSPG